jgi:WD40 repeat protein
VVSFSSPAVVRDLVAGKNLALPPDPIFAASALSADGRLVAFTRVLSKRQLLVWDAAAGKVLLDVETKGGILAFSPDGRKLVEGGETVVRVWDLQKHTLEGTLQVPGARHLVFSQDGDVLACCAGNQVVLLDTTTWQIRRLQSTGHELTVAAFSPDGKRLATGGGMGEIGRGGGVTIWDVDGGLAVLTLGRASEMYVRLAFSPDGQRLAAATGQLLAIVGGEASSVRVVVWDARPVPREE